MRQLVALVLVVPATVLAIAGGARGGPAVIVVSNHLTGEACAHPDVHTIQAAVDLAHAGDTIVVCEGTYHEGVRVTKPNLTIRAHMPLQTFLVGPGASGPSPDDGFTILANDVTIEGFDISHFHNASGNGGDGILVGYDDAGSGQRVDVTGASIQGNFVHANDDGVVLYDTSHHQVVGNEVDANSNASFHRKGMGIQICADPGGPSHDNVVADNSASRNDQAGIYAGSCTSTGDDFAGTVIRGNTLTHDELHPQNAIAALDVCCAAGTPTNRVLVEGNTVTDNIETGVTLDFGSQYVTLRGNTSSRNGLDGVLVYSSSNFQALQNTTDSNGVNGFRVQVSTNGVFKHDSAHGNSQPDLFWDGNGSMTFAKNHCGTAVPSKATWHCS